MGKRWTTEDDLLLRKLWGQKQAVLVSRLQRSPDAIQKRATTLGLEPQSQGLMTRNGIAKALGVDNRTVPRLLAECGAREKSWAPVRDRRRKSNAIWRGYDFDAVRIFQEKKDKLTITASAWAEREGNYDRYGMDLLKKFKLSFTTGRGVQARLPEAVFLEIKANAPGYWCSVWRTVLDCKEKLECSRWFLALVMEALLSKDSDWVEDYVSFDVRRQALRLLKDFNRAGS